MTKVPLPRDEYGHIQFGAEYGNTWIVEIQWTTDFDNRIIDPEKEEYARTLHGPFFTEEEAVLWMQEYPEFKEIHEVTVIWLNSVRLNGNELEGKQDESANSEGPKASSR